MTGYNKIKKRKLRRYDGGGSIYNPDYEYLTGSSTNPSSLQLTQDGAPQLDIKQLSNNSIEGTNNQGVQRADGNNYASGIEATGNLVSSAADGLNHGGTGTGQIFTSSLSGGAKGAATGARIGSSLGVYGTVVGATIGSAIGGTVGLFKGVGNRNKALARQRIIAGQQQQLFQNQSDQVLSQYPVNGVQDSQLYAYGGDITTVGNDIGTAINNNDNVRFINSKADKWGAINGKPINTLGGQLYNLRASSDKSLGLANDYQPARNEQQGSDIPTIRTNGGSRWDKTPQQNAADEAAYHKIRGYGRGGKIKNNTIEVPQFSTYADGGSPYEAEGGETIQGQDQSMEQEPTQLASDVQQINGPSHEQGGVMGQGGERIYSDRLKVTPGLAAILKTNGISISPKSTYADVSNKLGKLKGKFEDKTDGVGRNTAKVMLPRIEQSLDDTFNDQEMSKQTQAYKKFAKGGLIKYDDGGSPYDPNYVPLTGRSLGIEPRVFNNDLDTTQLALPKPEKPWYNNAAQKLGDYASNNEGELLNFGNYLANTGTINRLNTTVNPKFVPSPNYNYVDRSGSAVNRNSALLKTGIKNLTNAGQTVNASNIGSLYAKTLEGNSIIAGNENARKDAYNNEFNNRADKINAENTSIYNKAQDDSRDLQNQKIGLQLGARNAFQQGVVGNKAVKLQNELEQKRLLTVLATNDQNGVMTRFLTNYPKYRKLLSQYNSKD